MDCLSLSFSPDALPRTPSPSSNIRRPRTRTFDSREALSFLQRCTDFKQLKQIHSQILRTGLSHDQVLVANMLRLCSSYGQMGYASLLFYQLQSPTTFAWNLMIRGHTLNDNPREALLTYNLMMCRGVRPDKFTFPFVIRACIVSSAIDKGKEVHGVAFKLGFWGDAFVQNTVMDLYFKCGDLGFGCMVFDKMPVKNVVSWTTMVSGLVAHGELDAARGIFEVMQAKNVVSWTVMINGFARNRHPEEAFELFRRMQLENVRPNEFTLVSLLIACTELGSLRLGSWIHDFALKNGFELGVFLGTALIDMYSKCGSIDDAKKVFDKMQKKSLATWNSMITSLGVHGRGEEALDVFVEMERADVRPDAITFVGVLCACINMGNSDEGFRYFRYMSERYDIVPTIDHYGCMVELLNRAGMLDKAYELVHSTAMKLNVDL
ncbi:PREDICTED: pentatricopeptide repeat-containing protein At3g26630, chloroplastic [Nelumbo nucifera]|uniref:Pentatricopeptide repeat-containing protein At3g26630, chloroplastic n=1 Tax=Nelumbo nucifera TaxID=4432 RepID=A0A1U7ZAC9_NELNU|nr:PREDICTED: pentatricopeptide repeat-containing protein At3g26630, chloroplastic [Nelumbo nucifera]